MNRFAKLIVVLLLAAMTASLFGCTSSPAATTAPTTSTNPTTASTPSQAESTQPPAATPTGAPATAAAQPTATTPSQPVTLRYAHWNLGTVEENNINRQMIKAYTDLHPNVTVEIVDMSDPNNVGWEGLLTAMAAKGELPDVFAANNVPLYVQNGWLADVTQYTTSDADWAAIPQPLKDAFTYNGKVMGIPAGQFLMGYFVNKDLYDSANLDAPEYGISVDDFFNVATKLNNPAKGILGLDEQFPIEGWYPNTVDNNLKYYSFDGNHMNYNSAAFKQAVAKTTEMIPYTWQGLTAAQQKGFKSKNPGELFMNQEVGVRWDASWSVPDLVKNAKFNWDFVGVPGGNPCIVFDAMAVAKTSKNLDAAYDFAKWMTFSSDSYKKQAELAKAMDSAPQLPVSVTPDSLALYKSFFDKPGLNKALDNLNNSMLESLAKVVPGYIQARWEGKPGIDIGADKDVTIGWMLDNAPTGKFKFEDYSAKLEEFANKIMDDAKAQMTK